MTGNFVAVWYPGMERIFKGDPQKVAEEIMAIGDSAKPEQIYEKAKDETTELHKCLEWDDTVAADKYRLHQCRKINCSLLIKRDDAPADEPQEKIRFFYHDDISDGYVPVLKIVKDEDKYQALLQQAYSELRSFKQKYSCLSELKEIFALIA